MVGRFLCLAFAACLAAASSAAAVAVSAIGSLLSFRWLDPRPHWQLLGATPRSIFQTRRLGLA